MIRVMRIWAAAFGVVAAACGALLLLAGLFPNPILVTAIAKVGIGIFALPGAVLTLTASILDRGTRV
jgi:hypothetical protein